MARLLPGVYSAINDLSQIPEGAQTLNVGYIVQAERGPVNEWSLCTNPTDFLTKYTFSGKPDLTADPTFHSVIKVMAQTNTMYIVRAANNPLYGGAIVKKAQNHGFVLGVDQTKETFLLMIDKDEDTDQKLPSIGEPITLIGTGLFDGNYKVASVESTGYVHKYTDEVEEKIYEYDVYEVKVTGDIVFETTGLGIDINKCVGGNDDYFELVGDYLDDFEAFETEKAIITIIGASEPGSSGEPGVDNNGYYVVDHVELYEIQEEGEEEPTPFTRVYASKSPNGDIFKEEIEDLTGKGQLFINSKFQGTSVYRTPVVAMENLKIADIFQVDASYDEETGVTTKNIILNTDVSSKFAIGDKILIKGSPKHVVNDEEVSNDGEYTVVKKKYDLESNKTIIGVKEKFKFSEGPAGEGENAGSVYFGSVVNPEAAANSLGKDDLMLITGIDPGAYNGKEAFSIVSALDNKDSMVYYKGAEGLFAEPCTFDTMELTVYNADTNEALESFTFSRDPEAKAIDGSSLFVDDVVAGSAYIKVFNNPNDISVSNSTLAGSPLSASGGSNGGTVTPADMVRALSVFQDKTIPVSILGNGCSGAAESVTYQQALLELANTRKDMFVFLNSQAAAEKATLPSARAQAIVDYKKGTLANTSFYGCMYAPHVNTPDVFNSRDVKIGADAVAIAGWLNVINSLNYPYAYAGPRNGLVQGVTCDWKIGDMSGEAEMLNDASVNYIAYDGKVGRYYMQCQNTLQVANSAMRNIGVVLNVLDIKENLVNYLKEFINLPITDSLRRDIMDTVGDYLSPMTGVRFYNYAFQDVTTEADIAQDTLRYLLTVSPTRYAQRIYMTMNIVGPNFDFSILQSV